MFKTSRSQLKFVGLGISKLLRLSARLRLAGDDPVALRIHCDRGVNYGAFESARSSFGNREM